MSRLLSALDERASAKGEAVLSAEQSRELTRMADTCAAVLHREARSAEVFAQLLGRALRARDYARVDALADVMTARLAPSEMCEMARSAKSNPEWYAQAHVGLGTALVMKARSDPPHAPQLVSEALENYKQALVYYDELLKSHPKDSELRDAAAEAHKRLGK